MVEDGALTDRHTITLRSRARADTDQVLAARTGEATLIAGGRAERVRIIHAAVAAETHSRAGALLSAGGPLHPLEALMQTPQQLTYHRLQLLVGLLLLVISLGGLVLLLALFT